MQPLAPDDPSCIGPYRLLGRLGAGGMGRVFLARRDGDSRADADPVAVKLVRPELAQLDDFRRRFTREVRVARRVDGRWTAPVLDADTDAEVPWVATAYVPGPTLHAVVRGDFGPLPSASAHVLANRMGLALRGIHAAGLVHRDLKPSNVLLTVDGPRVIDFGIAHVLDAAADSLHTPSGALLGSPQFMSPEQVRGEPVSPASDVFSLGCVLAYAATGVSPFDDEGRSAHSVMFHIAYEEPELARLPEAVVDLVRDCLDKDPGQRPSVEEVVDRTRHAPPGAWLPAPLLDRLDRAASRPLPSVPRRREASDPAPEDTGVQAEFPEFPDDRPASAPDPLDLPELGITPPTIRHRPRARWGVGRRVGVLAGVVALVVGAGFGVQTVEQVVFPQDKARADLDVFAGSWLLRNTEQPLLVLRLDIFVSKVNGRVSVEWEAGRRGKRCRGDARATPDSSSGARRLVLSRFRTDQPEKDDACAPRSITLTAGAEGHLAWRQSHEEPAVAAVRIDNGIVDVPPGFLGTWRGHGTTVRMRRKDSADGLLVTTTTEANGHRCTRTSRVLYMDHGIQGDETNLHTLPDLPKSRNCPAPDAAYDYYLARDTLVRTDLVAPGELVLKRDD
ncbi:serine/threonine-protein kinase [Streptomyces sp. NPDC050145]|uniref:serine/threonine-protein kinase n=1 Tax=Streptomyces sp. NPDC050145 TaxID=3365602 RepID=UPI003799E6B4